MQSRILTEQAPHICGLVGSYTILALAPPPALRDHPDAPERSGDIRGWFLIYIENRKPLLSIRLQVDWCRWHRHTCDSLEQGRVDDLHVSALRRIA